MTLETLKSEAQIRAEKEHLERLEALNKPKTDKFDKNQSLENLPEVIELIQKAKKQWQFEDQSEPIIIYDILASDENKNNALELTVYHNGKIIIKPLTKLEFADLTDNKIEYFQGCEDLPNYQDIVKKAAEYLNSI